MARDRASRPEAAPLRLFAAVDVPERVKQVVVDGIEPWKERLGAGRWVPPENWHVTMKFMGRTWPRLRAWVEEACHEAAAAVRPFRVSLDGLGVFPRSKSARVLWVGLRDRTGGLAALAGALDEAMAREFPPEKRPYHPHLTVARFQPPVPVSDQAEDLAATRFEAEPFRVGTLVLYRSHLSPRGARYEPVERFRLSG